jgi:hypothetical protein
MDRIFINLERLSSLGTLFNEVKLYIKGISPYSPT